MEINGAHYRDVLLMQKLLPDIRKYSNFYIFHQDGVPTRRARETVELLQTQTSDFIPPTTWPSNSPDLNPVDYKSGRLRRKWSIERKIRCVDEIRQRILDPLDESDQRVIDASIKQWRARLHQCIRVEWETI